MKTIRAFIDRHPLLSFYALAFAITWGGLIVVVGGPVEVLGTPENFETRFAFVLLAWLAGPSVASLLMTGLVHGRAGFRDLLAGMTRWRVGVRWYMVALLIAPFLTMAVLLASLPRVSPHNTHHQRQSCPRPAGYRRGHRGRHLRGDGLDGVRHAHTA
jgi:uncharacterized protein